MGDLVIPTPEMTPEERQGAIDRNMATVMGWSAKAAAKPPSPWAAKRQASSRGTPKRTLEPGERGATESWFQTEFNRWISKNRDHPAFDRTRTQTFELKVSDGGTLNFDRVEHHQDEAARRAVTEDGCYHRIESAAHKFQSRKPWDSELVRNAQCFLAVQFHIKERGNRTFYLVPFDAWRALRDAGGMSMGEEEAGRVGVKCEL